MRGIGQTGAAWRSLVAFLVLLSAFMAGGSPAGAEDPEIQHQMPTPGSGLTTLTAVA